MELINRKFLTSKRTISSGSTFKHSKSIYAILHTQAMVSMRAADFTTTRVISVGTTLRSIIHIFSALVDKNVIILNALLLTTKSNNFIIHTATRVNTAAKY